MKALDVKIEDFLEPKLLQDFISYLRYEKSGGLAEASISRYLLNLKHLCIESGRHLFTIQKYADVSTFLRAIRQKNGWSGATAKYAADSYSVFYNWAARFQHIEHDGNPMRLGHEFRNKDRKQMDFFEWSDGDFQKLMFNPNNSDRQNAILETLRSAGPRASELCNFTFKELDLEGRCFRVKNGKGGKDRDIYFDEENQKALAKYVPKVKLFSTLPWVFQTEDYQKLSPPTLYKMIRRMCDKIGMAGCPQKFRRSLGGEMIANGADLTDVKDQLGHASIQTTARHYVHHKSARRKERFDKGVPRFGLSELTA